MISLVANSKGFSTQHKWSISVHCLEFRKTPSAALYTNACGFCFLSLLLLWGKHASQHIEWLVFQYVSTLCMINYSGWNCNSWKKSQRILTKWQEQAPKRLINTAVLLSLTEKPKSDKSSRWKRRIKYFLCIVKYFQMGKIKNIAFVLF
jgi:hypothetical protein